MRHYNISRLEGPRHISKQENFYDSIRYRDKHICQRCGKHQDEEIIESARRLSIHHIDGNHENDTPENCITYCASCHQSIEIEIQEAKKDTADLEIMFKAANHE